MFHTLNRNITSDEFQECLNSKTDLWEHWGNLHLSAGYARTLGLSLSIPTWYRYLMPTGLREYL